MDESTDPTPKPEEAAMAKTDTPEEEATYTVAEIAAEASSFDTTTWAVHGVFRAAGKDRLTETEFRAGLGAWRGE